MFPHVVRALMVVACAAALGRSEEPAPEQPSGSAATPFGEWAAASLSREAPLFPNRLFPNHGATLASAMDEPLPPPLDAEQNPLPRGYEPLDPWGRPLSDQDDDEEQEVEWLERETGLWPTVRDSALVYGALTLRDYRNFYRPRNLLSLGLGVGVAAILANSDLDEEFQSFVKNDVYSPKIKKWTRIIRNAGQGNYILPAYAVAVGMSWMLEDWEPAGVIGEWAVRSLRMTALGAPHMLLLQYVTGGTRPGDKPHTSHWKMFADNNGVSGHAFMGAIPFLSAASMIDNVPGKVLLYGASTVVAWTRIHDNRHYLSQSMLGWWLAFVASQAIAETNQEFSDTFALCALEDGSGLGIAVRW